MTSFDSITAAAKGLDDLYPILTERRYTAGWHKEKPSLWRQPDTPFRTMSWKYHESAQLMDLAGDWIGTDLAERRNLLMYNPVGDNEYASLPTLVAAYQMLKPKEHARAHRHTPNALRLVLDAADEVYTVVDSVQLPMRPGDILLTPGWTWHSHFNNGGRNAYWIDFLDVPLVHRLETMFFEPHPDHYQPVTETPDQSPLRFSLVDQQRVLGGDPANGHRRIALDTPSLRTIRINLHALAPGEKSLPRQATANQIFAVIEGAGAADVNGERIEWKRGDVFVVPMWKRHSLNASASSRLLEVSDEPVHQALGLFQERFG